MDLGQAQARLALIQTAMNNLLTGGVASYGVGDRHIKYMTYAELQIAETNLINYINRLQGGGFAVATFKNWDSRGGSC